MKPEKHDEEEILAALRTAFPAVNTELRRDLWPALQRRIEEPARKVPWYDLALAASVAAVAVLFPKLFLLLAYHL